MTGPIRGPDGLPLTDIVQPVLPILNIGDKQASPEQTDAESTDPAVRAEQERQRQEYLKALEKKKSDKAEGEGGIYVKA